MEGFQVGRALEVVLADSDCVLVKAPGAKLRYIGDVHGSAVTDFCWAVALR
jgi:hypothetical protein